jgi:hypothetical protein
MKKILTVFTFTAIFTSVSLFSFVSIEQKIEGIWQGTLKVQGIELRIIFKIKKDKNDALTATMDSPDQGANNIPMDTVKLEGSNLFMELKMAGGVYEGSISEDGKKIEGTWKQGGLDFPLVLEHTDKVAELKRPQEPKKPFPYKEEEVAYKNEKDEIKLAGTLTLPHREKALFPLFCLSQAQAHRTEMKNCSGTNLFFYCQTISPGGIYLSCEWMTGEWGARPESLRNPPVLTWQRMFSLGLDS